MNGLQWSVLSSPSTNVVARCNCLEVSLLKVQTSGKQWSDSALYCCWWFSIYWNQMNQSA